MPPRNYGERMIFRGGHYGYNEQIGIFDDELNEDRYNVWYTGFRASSESQL